MRKRIWDISIIAMLSVGVAVGGHLWISDRLLVLRSVYGAQAFLTQFSVQCSSGAPSWMKEAISWAISDNASLANQLVYADSGGQIHSCVSGWQNASVFDDNVSENTRFRYASMTKLLTADAILTAEKEGKLSIQDNLIGFFPELSELADPNVALITLAHLLTHSSGFDRMQSIDPMVRHAVKPWCPYEASPLKKIRLDHRPGQTYSYSNLNYCLLAMVLEKIYGKTYRDIIEEKYSISKINIKFVDDGYFFDEVKYDFRNSDFYGENYVNYFDFYALSSSMGLSGSAVEFAKLIKRMMLNGSAIFDFQLPTECEVEIPRSCFGYSVFPYGQEGGDVVLVQPGYLYAAPSLTLIDREGGVTVWVGSGTPRKGGGSDAMMRHLYKIWGSPGHARIRRSLTRIRFIG